jgi:hypothetical protein
VPGVRTPSLLADRCERVQHLRAAGQPLRLHAAHKEPAAAVRQRRDVAGGLDLLPELAESVRRGLRLEPPRLVLADEQVASSGLEQRPRLVRVQRPQVQKARQAADGADELADGHPRPWSKPCGDPNRVVPRGARGKLGADRLGRRSEQASCQRLNVALGEACGRRRRGVDLGGEAVPDEQPDRLDRSQLLVAGLRQRAKLLPGQRGEVRLHRDVAERRPPPEPGLDPVCRADHGRGLGERHGRKPSDGQDAILVAKPDELAARSPQVRPFPRPARPGQRVVRPRGPFPVGALNRAHLVVVGRAYVQAAPGRGWMSRNGGWHLGQPGHRSGDCSVSRL